MRAAFEQVRRLAHPRAQARVEFELHGVHFDQLARQVLCQYIGEVFAAEAGITCDDLEHSDVERASAQVEHHRTQLLVARMKAVGQRSRGQLVDDAFYA